MTSRHSITIGLDTSTLVSDLLDLAAAFVAAADRIAPTETDEADDDEPTTVGPERLAATLLAVPSTLPDTLNHIRARLGEYPADATAGQVYADWFGAA